MRDETVDLNSVNFIASRSNDLRRKPSQNSKGISSIEALNVYRDILTPHERKEVLQYDKVYYVGRASEKHPMTNGQTDRNSQSFSINQQSQLSSKSIGLERIKSTTDALVPVFDDAENFYRIIKHDHIAYRFEVLSLLGKGSFGQVVLAIDHMKGTQVALKIIRTEPRFTRQAREEIRILETLRQMRGTSSTNPDGLDFPIVQLFEHFTFRKHICMTFELLSINLYDLLKLNKFAGLPRDRVRRISFQVLKALYYVEKAGIIHCDLKPENVLLIWPPDKDSPPWTQNRCSPPESPSGSGSMKDPFLTVEQQRDFVKLIDFGSSCFKKGPTYPYIQSRFYRAPEVILRLGYAQPIDIWSFGCLVAELINGLPLFPGEDEADQLACIMEILGLPPTEMIQKCPHIDRFFIEHRSENKKSSDILNFVDRMSNGTRQDITYLPRYCLIRYPESGGSPELLPGISKRAGNLRGVPGSMPLLKAILEPRHRRFRRKDPQSMANLATYPSFCKSSEDDAALMKDNELLLGFMLSCLTWSPAERVKPYKAIQNMWLRNFTKKSVNSQGTNSTNNREVINKNNRIRSMEISHEQINGSVEASTKYTASNDLPALIPRRRKRLSNLFSESLQVRPTVNLDLETDIAATKNGSFNLDSKEPDVEAFENLSLSPSQYSKVVSTGRSINGGPTINTISISPTKTKGVELTTNGTTLSENAQFITSNKRVTLIYPSDPNEHVNRGEDNKHTSINRSLENLSLKTIPTKPVLRTQVSLNSQSNGSHGVFEEKEFIPFINQHSQQQEMNSSVTSNGARNSQVIYQTSIGTRPYSEYHTQSKSQVTAAEDIIHEAPLKSIASVPHLNVNGDNERTALNRKPYRQAPPLSHEYISNDYGTSQQNQQNHPQQMIIRKLTDQPTSVSFPGHSRLFHVIRPSVNSQTNTSTSNAHHLNSNEPRLIRINNLRQGTMMQIAENNDVEHYSNSTWTPQRSAGNSFKSVTRLEQVAPEVAPKPSSRDIVLLNPIRQTDHPDSYTNVNAYTTSVWAPQPYYQSSNPSNVVYRRVSGSHLRGTTIELQPYSHLTEY